MVQFNEWFDKNVKASHMLSPFVSWLENKGIQGIYDATFDPETLFEEWASFLFHISRQMPKHLELSAPLQNSIEIGETSKGELYLKSIKLYFLGRSKDAERTMNQIFAMYDEARKQINERKG